MTEAEWLKCGDPAEMLRYLGDASRRKLRFFAAECCRLVWFLVKAYHSKRLELPERMLALSDLFADGEASADELGEAIAQADAVLLAGGLDRTSETTLRIVRELHPGLNVNRLSETVIDFLVGYSVEGWIMMREFRVDNETYMLLRQEHTQGESETHCHLLREMYGNPFRPVTFSPQWRTQTAVSLAAQMYDSREFSAMPILADALQDAGCDNDDILGHCRDVNATHVRGCWVCDLVLGRE